MYDDTPVYDIEYDIDYVSKSQTDSIGKYSPDSSEDRILSKNEEDPDSSVQDYEMLH